MTEQITTVLINDPLGYTSFKAAYQGNYPQIGALDIETTVSKAPTGTQKYWTDMFHTDQGERLICVGFTYDGSLCYVLPYDSPYYKVVMDMLVDQDWIMQNGYFDTMFLRTIGYEFMCKHDTMAMSYLLDPDELKSLEVLSERYLGLPPYKDVEYAAIEDEPFEKVAQMNAIDVSRTYKLYRPLADRINEDPQMSRLYQWVLMPAIRELVTATINGVPIDTEAVKKKERELVKSSSEILASLIESVPEPTEPWAKPSGWRVTEKGHGPFPFNPRSTKQVAHLIYDLYELEPEVYTDTGSPSTSEEALTLLPSEGPHAEVTQMILDYRTQTKAISSFLEPWQVLTSKDDGRLHPRYKPLHVRTGRLSAEYPNIQQVPRDKEWRSLFTAPEGFVWMKADYSQIELRLGAWQAGEERMLDAFNEGEDLHALTARQVLGSANNRQGGKTLNFGLLYGAFPKTLQRVARMDYGLELSLAEATQYRADFFALYPSLEGWHREREDRIKHTGLSTSPLGRVRHLPNAQLPENRSTWSYIGAAVREGMNHTVQSMASDMLLRALTVLGPEMRDDDVQVIAEVHDEIDFLVPLDRVDTTAYRVKEVMEDVTWLKRFGINLTVPVLADVETGPSWGELETYDVQR